MLSRLLPLSLALILAAPSSWGCAARRGPPPPPVVKKIKFEGNGLRIEREEGFKIVRNFGTSDLNLRGAMEQRQNPPLAWIAARRRRVYLDEETLELDGWRVETWYAHHGFYDARFLGWDVVTVRQGGGLFNLPPAVKVIGRVAEGPPTLVEAPTEGEPAIVWEGIRKLGPGHEALLGRLRTGSALQPGGRFELEALEQTESFTLGVLQEQSYARAQVQGSAQIWPEQRQAQVHIHTEPGPYCFFGPVEIIGDIGVPERFIRSELTIKEGSPYKASDLIETQQRLFALGVFSVVNVSPVLEGTEGEIVPIRIELAERKYREVKTGVGTAIEAGKLDGHVTGTFRHVNLFNRLVDLTFTNQVGYTIISDLAPAEAVQAAFTAEDQAFNITSQGLAFESTLTTSVPRFPAPRLELLTEVGYERGVEQGYQFDNPRLAPAIIWKPPGNVQLQFGYALDYFNYFNVQPALLVLEDELGRQKALESYLLSALNQSVVYDTRDDPLTTNQGSYHVLRLTEAGGPVGGTYSFLGGEADLRTYVPLRSLARLRVGEYNLGRTLRRVPLGSLAGRLGGGVLVPYGNPATAVVPLNERFKLGGGDNVRGWVADHLGPYVFKCPNLDEDGDEIPDDADGICESPSGQYAGPDNEVIPLGGTVYGLASFEFRRYWRRSSHGMVLFTDLGMVWTDLDQLLDDVDGGLSDSEADEAWDPLLAPSVGVGYRYMSPIGPIRVDLGYRLGHDPRFEEIDDGRRLRLHLAISEAF